VADVVRVLDDLGAELEAMELHEPSLDDVFAEATGRRLEGAEDAAADGADDGEAEPSGGGRRGRRRRGGAS
jgi:ABC-2 type transport system ATP-binding protein